MPITSFTDKHVFLSNFYYSRVLLDGVEYRSVEHAYQASKTFDPAQREYIRAIIASGNAKRAGSKRGFKSFRLTLRPDWEQVKDSIMLDLLRQKFRKEPLRRLLLATGTAELIEGNWWGDTYWGVSDKTGEGLNRLGQLLMQVREELRNEDRSRGIDKHSSPSIKPAVVC